jgi:cysteine synthase A
VYLTPRAQGFEGPIAARDKFRGQPGYYVPDQFGNPDNARCHYETTGREIASALRARRVTALGAFVAGVGTGGTLMGAGRALRECFPGLRVVAVEPSESNVMCGKPAGDHEIQGIGDGFIPPIVDMDAVDEVLAIPTADARSTAGEIRRRYGYCVGMSSGANFAAARMLRDRGLAVATVWADCSDRYGTLGLAGPSSADVCCPMREHCAQRAASVLDAQPR